MYLSQIVAVTLIVMLQSAWLYVLRYGRYICTGSWDVM